MNQRLLRKAESRPLICVTRQRHLRLYGHAARVPEADPAHQVLFSRQLWVEEAKGKAHRIRGSESRCILLLCYQNEKGADTEACTEEPWGVATQVG